MRRILLMVAIATLLAVARPATAQPPAGKDETRKLQAELERLRSQIRDLEAQLKKSGGEAGAFERKEPADARPGDKKESKGFGPPFGKKKDGMGPDGAFPPFAKKKDGKGPGGFEPPFAKKKDGKGPGGPPPFAKKKGPPGEPWAGGPAWARGGERTGFGRGFGPPAGGPPWARSAERGFGPPRGDFTPPVMRSRSSRDLEMRLDRIERELDELRRLMRRR